MWYLHKKWRLPLSVTTQPITYRSHKAQNIFVIPVFEAEALQIC